jgi:c-di-GMP-binding flagellar brake protein YcgR
MSNVVLDMDYNDPSGVADVAGKDGSSLNSGKMIEIIGSSNRRREKRHKVTWEFSGRYIDKKKTERAFRGVVEDISTQGLLLSTSTNLPAKSRFFISMKTFVCGKAKSIGIVVEARHVSLSGDLYRIGGQFLRLSEENRRFLEKYIRGVNPH